MYSHNTLYAPCCIAPGAGLPLCSVLCLLLLLSVLHPHHLLLLLPVHLARSAAEERHNYPAGDAHTSIHIHTLGGDGSYTLVFGDPRRSLLLFVTTGASLECVESLCVYVYVCVDAWYFWMLSRCFFFLYSRGDRRVLDATALLLYTPRFELESCPSHM